MGELIREPSFWLAGAAVVGLIAVNAGGPVLSWLRSLIRRGGDDGTQSERRRALEAADLAYRLADHFAELDDAEGIRAATVCAQRAVMAPFVEAEE